MFISVFTRAPLPILSQINLHNDVPNYLFNIHFNSIPTLMLQLSIRSSVSPLTLNTIHFSPTYAAYPLISISSISLPIMSHVEQKPIGFSLDLYSTSNHLSPPPSYAAISPLHPVPEHPQPIFCPQDDRRSFTVTLEKAKIAIQHIFIFRPTFFDSKLWDSASTVFWLHKFSIQKVNLN